MGKKRKINTALPFKLNILCYTYTCMYRYKNIFEIMFIHLSVSTTDGFVVQVISENMLSSLSVRKDIKLFSNVHQHWWKESYYTFKRLKNCQKCFSFARKTIQYGQRKEVNNIVSVDKEIGHGPVVSSAVEKQLILVIFHSKKTIAM